MPINLTDEEKKKIRAQLASLPPESRNAFLFALAREMARKQMEAETTPSLPAGGGEQAVQPAEQPTPEPAQAITPKQEVSATTEQPPAKPPEPEEPRTPKPEIVPVQVLKQTLPEGADAKKIALEKIQETRRQILEHLRREITRRPDVMQFIKGKFDINTPEGVRRAFEYLSSQQIPARAMAEMQTQPDLIQRETVETPPVNIQQAQYFTNVLNNLDAIERQVKLYGASPIKQFIAGLLPQTPKDWLVLGSAFIPGVGGLASAAVSAGMTAGERKRISDLTEKAKQGTATDEELLELATFVTKYGEKANQPILTTIGEAIRTMIPYAAQIGAAQKMSPLGAIKGLPEMTGVAGTAAKAVGMTLSPVGVMATLEGVARRTNPVPVFVVDSKTNDVVYQLSRADNFWEALPKSALSTWTSMFSEMSGELMPQIAAPFATALKKRIIADWLLKNNMLSKTGKLLVPVGRVVQEFLKSGGWHGRISEFGEERIDDLMKSVFGLQEPGEQTKLIDPQQWLVDATAITLFDFFAGAPVRVARIQSNNAARKALKPLLEPLTGGEYQVRINDVVGKVSELQNSGVIIETEGGKRVKIPYVDFKEIQAITEPPPAVRQTLDEIKSLLAQPTTPTAEQPAEQITEQPPAQPAEQAEERQETTPPAEQPTLVPEDNTDVAVSRILSAAENLGIKITPENELKIRNAVKQLPAETIASMTEADAAKFAGDLFGIAQKTPETQETPEGEEIEELGRQFEQTQREIQERLERLEEKPAEQPPEQPPVKLEIPDFIKTIAGEPPAEYSGQTWQDIYRNGIIEITLDTQTKRPKKIRGRITNYDPAKKLLYIAPLTAPDKPRPIDIALFNLPTTSHRFVWEKDLMTPAVEETAPAQPETPPAETGTARPEKFTPITRQVKKSQLSGNEQEIRRITTENPVGTETEILGIKTPQSVYVFLPLDEVKTSFDPDTPPEIKSIIQPRVETGDIVDVGLKLRDIHSQPEPKFYLQNTADGAPVVAVMTDAAGKPVIGSLTNLRVWALKTAPDEVYNKFEQFWLENLDKFFPPEQIEKARQYIEQKKAEGKRVVLARLSIPASQDAETAKRVATELNVPTTRAETLEGMISRAINLFTTNLRDLKMVFYDVFKQVLPAGEKEGKEFNRMACASILGGIFQHYLSSQGITGHRAVDLLPSLISSIASGVHPKGTAQLAAFLVKKKDDIHQRYCQELEITRIARTKPVVVPAIILAAERVFDYAANERNVLKIPQSGRTTIKNTIEKINEVATKLKRKSGIEYSGGATLVFPMLYGLGMMPSTDAKIVFYNQFVADIVADFMAYHARNIAGKTPGEIHNKTQELIRQIKTQVGPFAIAIDLQVEQLQKDITKTKGRKSAQPLLELNPRSPEFLNAFYYGVARNLASVMAQQKILEAIPDLDENLTTLAKQLSYALPLVCENDELAERFWNIIDQTMASAATPSLFEMETPTATKTEAPEQKPAEQEEQKAEPPAPPLELMPPTAMPAKQKKTEKPPRQITKTTKTTAQAALFATNKELDELLANNGTKIATAISKISGVLDWTKEQAVIVFITDKGEIEARVITTGDPSATQSAAVAAREIAERSDVKFFVTLHNHPDGKLKPSKGNVLLTRNCAEMWGKKYAGEIILTKDGAAILYPQVGRGKDIKIIFRSIDNIRELVKDDEVVAITDYAAQLNTGEVAELIITPTPDAKDTYNRIMPRNYISYYLTEAILTTYPGKIANIRFHFLPKPDQLGLALMATPDVWVYVKPGIVEEIFENAAEAEKFIHKDTAGRQYLNLSELFALRENMPAVKPEYRYLFSEEFWGRWQLPPPQEPFVASAGELYKSGKLVPGTVISVYEGTSTEAPAGKDVIYTTPARVWLTVRHAREENGTLTITTDKQTINIPADVLVATIPREILSQYQAEQILHNADPVRLQALINYFTYLQLHNAKRNFLWVGHNIAGGKIYLTQRVKEALQTTAGSVENAIKQSVKNGICDILINDPAQIAAKMALTYNNEKAAVVVAQMLNFWLSGKLGVPIYESTLELWDLINSNRKEVPEALKRRLAQDYEVEIKNTDPKKVALELGLNPDGYEKFIGIEFLVSPTHIRGMFTHFIGRHLKQMCNVKAWEWSEFVKTVDAIYRKHLNRELTDSEKAAVQRFADGETTDEMLKIIAELREKKGAVEELQEILKTQDTIRNTETATDYTTERIVSSLQKLAMLDRVAPIADDIYTELASVILEKFDPDEWVVLEKIAGGEQITPDDVANLVAKYGKAYEGKTPQDIAGMLIDSLNDIIRSTTQRETTDPLHYEDMPDDLTLNSPQENEERNDIFREIKKTTGIDYEEMGEELFVQKVINTAQELARRARTASVVWLGMPFWMSSAVRVWDKNTRHLVNSFINEAEASLWDYVNLPHSVQRRVAETLMQEDAAGIKFADNYVLYDCLAGNRAAFEAYKKMRNAFKLAMDWLEQAYAYVFFTADAIPYARLLMDTYASTNKIQLTQKEITNCLSIIADWELVQKFVRERKIDPTLRRYGIELSTLEHRMKNALKSAKQWRENHEYRTPVQFDGENYIVTTTDGREFRTQDRQLAWEYVKNSEKLGLKLKYHNIYFPHMWEHPYLTGERAWNSDVAGIKSFPTYGAAMAYFRNRLANTEYAIVRTRAGYTLYHNGTELVSFRKTEEMDKYLKENGIDPDGVRVIIPPINTREGDASERRQKATALFLILNNLDRIAEILKKYAGEDVDLAGLKSAIVNEINEQMRERLAARSRTIRYIGYDAMLNAPLSTLAKWVRQMAGIVSSLAQPTANTLVYNIEQDRAIAKMAADALNAELTTGMRVAHHLTGLYYTLDLGGKLSFALLTQPQQQLYTYGYLSAFYDGKTATNAMLTAVGKTIRLQKVLAIATAAYMKLQGKLLAKQFIGQETAAPVSLGQLMVAAIEKARFLTDTERQVLIRGIKDGVISPMRMNDIVPVNQVYQTLNIIANASEINNRICAMLAATEAERRRGETDPDIIYNRARTCTLFTQFNYILQNRPKITRNLLGTLVYQYSSFLANSFFLMKTLLNKKARAAVMVGLIAFLLGGAKSIPVLGELFFWAEKIWKRYFATPAAAMKVAKILRKRTAGEKLLYAVFNGVPAFAGIPGGTLWGYSTDPFRFRALEFFDATSRWLDRLAYTDPKVAFSRWSFWRDSPFMPRAVRQFVDVAIYKNKLPSPDAEAPLSLLEIQRLPRYLRLDLARILYENARKTLPLHEVIIRGIGVNPQTVADFYTARSLVNTALASWYRTRRKIATIIEHSIEQIVQIDRDTEQKLANPNLTPEQRDAIIKDAELKKQRIYDIINRTQELWLKTGGGSLRPRARTKIRKMIEFVPEEEW